MHSAHANAVVAGDAPTSETYAGKEPRKDMHEMTQNHQDRHESQVSRFRHTNAERYPNKSAVHVKQERAEPGVVTPVLSSLEDAASGSDADRTFSGAAILSAIKHRRKQSLDTADRPNYLQHTDDKRVRTSMSSKLYATTASSKASIELHAYCRDSKADDIRSTSIPPTTPSIPRAERRNLPVKFVHFRMKDDQRPYTTEYVFYHTTPPKFVTTCLKDADRIRRMLQQDLTLAREAEKDKVLILTSREVSKYRQGQIVDHLGPQRNVSGIVSKVLGSRECGTSGPGKIVVVTHTRLQRPNQVV